MEMIRRYFTQIKAQLVGLTVSQKLLIGLLALVMLATILFTVAYSAKPQMVPLIAQAMTAEDIQRAEIVLKEGRYDYQVSGDRMLVPTAQAYAIRGELASKGALPKDLSTAFSRAIQAASPFMTESMNTRAWNSALQEELTKILREFPYLDSASVIVAMGQPSTLSRPAQGPTATVTVKVKGGQTLTAGQVQAIVEMVQGAVPGGMKREDVHVIGDGMRAYHAPSSDSSLSADLLSFKKIMEDSYTEKLYTMFADVADVKIAVNVVPDLSTRTIDATVVDPKNAVSKVISETNRESSNTNGSGPGGEPGVTPNTGLAVGDGTSANKAGGSTTTDNRTENRVVIGETHTKTLLPAGVEIKEMTASLTMPRSYFLAIYRRMLKDPKVDPEDKDLQPVIDQQIKVAVARAKNAIGAKTDEQIRVDWFDDTIAPRGPDLVATSTGFAAGTLPALISQYAKQGVLALVALGALGMMLMMVRRGVPAGADGDVDTGIFFGGGGGAGKRKRAGNVEQLDAADDVFGEANEGDAVLTGIELDDETLQSRKMVDEVSTMIKENPENAAALVKRWMTKST